MEQLPVKLIGEYGFFGIALAAVCWLLLRYRVDYAKCIEERFKDLKSQAEITAANTAAMTALTTESQRRTQAQEAMVKALEMQTAEVARSREEVEQLQREVQRLLALPSRAHP